MAVVEFEWKQCRWNADLWQPEVEVDDSDGLGQLRKDMRLAADRYGCTSDERREMWAAAMKDVEAAKACFASMAAEDWNGKPTPYSKARATAIVTPATITGTEERAADDPRIKVASKARRRRA